MTAASILQFVLYGAVLLALTPLLGGYMARVFAGERVFLTPVLGPVEGLIYGLCGVRADREQHWTAYTAAMLAFNLLGMLLLYALLRLQAVLPLNPTDMPPVPPTWRSTPPSASPPTPTGRSTAARRRSAISRRWPG